MTIFHQSGRIPVNSCILLDSREDALAYPTGDLRLGFCGDCGFVSNLSFEAALTEYSGRYEETQAYSNTFNAFHQKLAERLIQQHGLHGKHVIEIGCGKGEFLSLLCRLGHNSGTGFDPGVDKARVAESASDTEFIADFYSEKYANRTADFFVCKMTLEHIHPTADFIRMVRDNIGDNAGVGIFFQVPEATRILSDCAFEDIYYEHCSYFTPESLRYLFESNGFEVDNITTEYADQYLTIEAHAVDVSTAPARVRPNQSAGTSSVAGLVASFPERFGKKLLEWQERLDAFARRGAKVVLWGGGSKAVAFISSFENNGAIEYCVDINPYRQQHYLPGSGTLIVAPEFLTEYEPDVIIIMNAVYRDEIEADLLTRGLSPEIIAL